jgi:hypothetical protein
MTLAITAALVVAGCQPPGSPAEQMMSQVELEQQESELPQPEPGVMCGETPVHFFANLHNVLVMSNADITWVDLSAEERARFLKAFNASPPVSNLGGDGVRIYKKSDTKKFFLAITDGPCVISGSEVSARLVAHWYRGNKIPTVKKPLSKGI